MGEVIKINFGVPPDGRYKCRIADGRLVDDAVEWRLCAEGWGGDIRVITSLRAQSLWWLRSLLECAGMQLPRGEMDLNFDDVAGRDVGAVVVNGKVVQFVPPDQLHAF